MRLIKATVPKRKWDKPTPVWEGFDALPIACEFYDDWESKVAKGELPPGLYLGLFHGRDTVDEDMEDMGFGGPVIGPLRWAHTTYACDLKLLLVSGEHENVSGEHENVSGEHENVGFVEGMIPHRGKYYSDWTVFHTDCAKED